MKEKRRLSIPAIGGSSLLTIFAVLCLTVFALLSLSTVQAEKRMADASHQAVSDYYAADAQAEAIFARLRNGEPVPGVAEAGDIYTYTCPISQQQTLLVELKHTDGVWEVLRWQAMVTEEPNIEETLTVWSGKGE